jgi:hypothetical protein
MLNVVGTNMSEKGESFAKDGIDTACNEWWAGHRIGMCYHSTRRAIWRAAIEWYTKDLCAAPEQGHTRRIELEKPVGDEDKAVAEQVATARKLAESDDDTTPSTRIFLRALASSLEREHRARKEVESVLQRVGRFALDELDH